MSKLITTALILTITAKLFAQQLPFSSQYYTNQFITNPAFTGTKENTNVFLTHRSQWTGIAGAPQTSFLTVDGPIRIKNVGLGLNVYSDVTGITSRVGAAVNYSYKLKINDNNHLYLGLAVGVFDNRIDFSKTIVRDVDDPFLFSTAQHKTVFSADFGLAYVFKKLEVGVAVPQLLGNKIKYTTASGNDSYYNLARHYQGSVKYTFDVSKEKEITAYPLVMVRYAQGSVFQYDVNAVLDWKKIGWLGVTYHSNNAVAASVGVRYKNLSIGYAYDFGISKISSYTGSSSEFLLSFTFGKLGKDPAELLAEKATKDSLNEVINQLTIKTDDNKKEIDNLKLELGKVKTQPAETKTSSSSETSLTEMLMRNASATDFVDEDGHPIGVGFYVVIGTFSKVENATKFKKANIIKGYTNVKIIQNIGTKTYYVYVLKVNNKLDAISEYTKFKVEYPDVWIQNLE